MSNNDAGKSNGSNNFDELFKDEFAVMLLQGKNSFGDMIYSYIKVTLPNIKRLYAAINSGSDFAPSDYGTIIASGKGIPSEELRKEMADTYNMLKSDASAAASPNANGIKPLDMQKKAWDEY